MTGDMWTVTAALADSLLVRWFMALAIVCAVVTVALVGLRALFRWADGEVERHVQAALAVEADDWSEEPRTTIEAPWLDEISPAPELADTPIYQAMRHEEDVLFAASVLADIDDWTGGDGAA